MALLASERDSVDPSLGAECLRYEATCLRTLGLEHELQALTLQAEAALNAQDQKRDIASA